MYIMFRYALHMSENEAEDKLLELLPAIQDFCLKYLHSEPSKDKGYIELKRFGVCAFVLSVECVCVQ